jgi:hypothetical protein
VSISTMAPTQQAAPRRAETTGRCALPSSSSSPKESSRGSPNQRENRRFLTPAAGIFFEFRPSPTSSSVSEHTDAFLVTSRTSWTSSSSP